MKDISRRGFLAGTAGMLGGVATGCGDDGGQENEPEGAPEDVTVVWWDHFQALASVFEGAFQQYKDANPGVTIERTQTAPDRQGQALQLAHQSDQMPDVLTPAGLGVPIQRLHADGWFAPLQLSSEAIERLPEGSLLNGVTIFDEQVYSLPLFSFRQHETTTWYNRELVDATDIDPDRDMASWDGFRAALRNIKSATGQAGWIEGLQVANRIENRLDNLAMTGGGSGAIDQQTGEYTYDGDAYLNALEFYLAMESDGTLFPGSTSLNPLGARSQWATGIAGIFFDGPWNIGIIKQNAPDFTDKVAVTTIPTADGGSPALYRMPEGGSFWLSSSSERHAEASGILDLFTTEEFYIGLAEAMDQPPLDLSVVEASNAEPVYKRVLELYAEHVFLAPSPVVRNPAVADVQAAMTPVTPSIGAIIQGLISGDVTDGPQAFRDYKSKIAAERDRAIDEINAAGGSVSVDDWRFDNWQPRQDFTDDMYNA